MINKIGIFHFCAADRTVFWTATKLIEDCLAIMIYGNTFILCLDK